MLFLDAAEHHMRKPDPGYPHSMLHASAVVVALKGTLRGFSKNVGPLFSKLLTGGRSVTSLADSECVRL